MNAGRRLGAGGRRAIIASMLVLAAVNVETAQAGPVIAPGHQAHLTITDVGNEFFSVTHTSKITQMAFGPGPDPDMTYLFLASHTRGTRRLAYDPASGALVGPLVTVDSTPAIGIAFHDTGMYLSEVYDSTGAGNKALSRIWRLQDTDGDGLYAANEPRAAIVAGVPRDAHAINQLQIVSDTLYAGVGVRTRNGAFLTYSGDLYGESAYGGSIAMIEDLTQVPFITNGAGLFPDNTDVADYRDLVNGTNPIGASPYTSTDPAKFRVHSSGTRNPFGLGVDGDDQLWFTNNFHRAENHVYDRENILAAEGDVFAGDGLHDNVHDQLFRAVHLADYGYRNGNWQNNPTAHAAGFFLPSNRTASLTFDNYADPANPADLDLLNQAYDVLHDPANPEGLGPSSSSNGLDFYGGNDLPIQYHKDAFIARWNFVSFFDPPPGVDEDLTFTDVVAVDTDTAAVTRIASGFENPIDVLADENGNLLVADWNGSIHRINAASPRTGPHPFVWGSDADGAWSDRLRWNSGQLPEADRLVPHAWGTARYAVVIDRPGAAPTVVLDQDATIESVAVADQLRLGAGHTLTVQSALTLTSTGTLSGDGTVRGDVISSGSVSPGVFDSGGISPGVLTVSGQYFQSDSARLVVELGGTAAGSEHDQLIVNGDGWLAGLLEVVPGDALDLRPGMEFTVIDVGGALNGQFWGLADGGLVSSDPDTAWELRITYAGGDGNDVVLSVVPEPGVIWLVGMGLVVGIARRGFRKRVRHI